MTLIALVFSAAVTALGVLGIVAPSKLIEVVRKFENPTGLYVAAGLRLLFGVALFFAASMSRAPDALRVLGVIVIIAGVATPFFGLKRFRKLLDWWSSRGESFIRCWAAIALLFGLLLLYALIQ